MSIADTFTAFQQLVDADTDCTTGSLEIVERININAMNKYMNLADSAAALDTTRASIVKNKTEITEYCRQVDEITLYIDNLEALTQEVDEWSKELEVKARRLKSHHV